MVKKNFVVLGALVACLYLASSVNAALVVSGGVGAQPLSGMNYVTFDAITDGGTENGLTLNLTPDAALVTGAAAGLYAPPVLSNGNGANFGGQPDGVDTTQYVTSGKDGVNNPGAAARMSFATDQFYFGLLWGSIDRYNSLTFYDAADKVVGSVVGSHPVLLPANGNQGVNGTMYVNILSDTGFRYVVASSTQYAFEFDNVAYGVPEPAAMLVWGFLSVAGLYLVRRRRA